MNTRKQYTKPHCTLVLDGFDENSEFVGDSSQAQESSISILTSAECYFATSNQRLSGGRAFLENLASAVSSYAQEFLSGLSHSQENPKKYPKIQVLPTDKPGVHNLTLEPDPKEGASKQKIVLKTLELFDLVEVIDQFYADTKALPDVSSELELVNKRFRQPDEPLAQRVIPLITGTISLAIAAGLFFVLPIPEVREPEPALESAPTTPVPTTPMPSEDTNSSEPIEEAEDEN